ncbi:hypothetical protein QTN47_07100 [Danxiaibacter flavus]|uniref:Uncharacterized protein n=1 Tax=Danxiaibacter flavus TaxID=3049108 RepID=A0ABV3ZCQ2_9BACT|nr:hypothetical protein QNM32_07100 [Chitinophagaceae bacterium DXS]
MKRFIVKQSFYKPLLLMAMAVLFFCATALAGLDSYKIYLNGKLLVSQAANQSTITLPLEEAKSGDMLVVYYTHCHGELAKDRSLVLKDASGNVIKEWKFGNANSATSSMSIPVKDILEVQKKNTHLQLYYAAGQLTPNGQLLAGI